MARTRLRLRRDGKVAAVIVPRKSKRLKRILLVVGALVLLSPCAACWWGFVGYTTFYIQTMPVYPEATEVWFARTYEHAGTSTQARYFRTDASFDDVHSYYVRLTAPVVTPQYGIGSQSREYYRTVFNPYGGIVPVITAEFTEQVANASENLYCYYRLRYQCVQVEVIDFGETEPVELPHPASDFGLQPTSEPPELYGGRLIIYTYHINGF